MLLKKIYWRIRALRKRQRRIPRRRKLRNEFQQAVRHSKGKVCIDLGANVGVYTRKMAQGIGGGGEKPKLVIAFEPDPWTCARLQENVSGLDNVRIEEAAVGTRDGKVLLYRHLLFLQDRVFHSASTSVFSRKKLDKNSPVEARQVDFLKYLEELKDPVGVLKIDIEGAEIELLEALFDRPELLGRIDYIFAEMHGRFTESLRLRVRRLRKRAKRIRQPRINLKWQ